MFCRTVSRASQVRGGRNQWDGWFLTSQQLTEHRTTPSSQCQLKRSCVSNMSAFVLLPLKLHQREFPKAARKQVKKAGIKRPYQGCTVSLSYPGALRMLPVTFAMGVHRGPKYGKENIGNKQVPPLCRSWLKLHKTSTPKASETPP